MKSNNIFPEQDKLAQEIRKEFLANITLLGCAFIGGIAGFLFLVWGTVAILRYMGVL